MSDFYKIFGNSNSEFASILRAHGNKSLRSYIQYIAENMPDVRTYYGDVYVEVLNSFLSEGVEITNPISNKYPVIQQADHSGLVLSTEQLLNNALFYFVMQLDKYRRPAVTLQCNTVSNISSRNPLSGPLFVSFRGKSVPIHYYSTRLLSKSNFCLLNEPFEFKSCELEEYIGRVNIPSNLSAQDVFLQFNNSYFRTLVDPSSVEIKFVDDRVTNQSIAELLREEESLFYRILFVEKNYEAITTVKKTQKTDSRMRLSYTTDFFWWADGKKLRSIQIESVKKGRITFSVKDLNMRFCISAEDLSQRLERGDMHVDRFLGYLIRNIVSGINAIGGSSQQDSLFQYRDLIIRANNISSFLSNEELNVITMNTSFLSGSCILNNCNEIAYSVLSRGSVNVLHEYFDSSLFSLIGDCSSVKYMAVN